MGRETATFSKDVVNFKVSEPLLANVTVEGRNQILFYFCKTKFERQKLLYKALVMIKVNFD